LITNIFFPAISTTTSDNTTSAFELPSPSSWQDEDENTGTNPAAQTDEPRETPGSLVDPDFRGKFVENQKKIASSTNLAAMGRMRKTGSVVRFADEMPQDLRKGKEREQLPSVEDEPSPPPHTPGSEAIEDGSSNDESAFEIRPRLPRTQSQLSLMIKEKRKESGGENMAPLPAVRRPSTKGNGPKLKEKEEELLQMGRRDGVTKAGGVRVPKQHRVSESLKHGYESSSPPPIF